MPEAIKAGKENLIGVFCDQYLFEIPEYQRPYTWTMEQVGALLDDLISAIGEQPETKVEDKAPYFLGSIVLIKGGTPASQVVDGQQRLTTLTILLCALRDLSNGGTGEELDTHICQRESEIRGTDEVMRLKLRRKDQDFFYDNVQTKNGIPEKLKNVSQGETDSQERIRENAKYLYKELKKCNEQQRKDLAKFIMQRCYLVVVSATNESSAYRIFSVMNDRGLNLSVTDILKAKIIGGISNTDHRQVCSDKWEDLEEGLGRDKFGDLFSHIRMIYVKAKQRANLQDEFEKYVLKDIAPKDFIDKVLEPCANAYEKVLLLGEPDKFLIDELKACLQSLGRLNNFDWIPPAIAFFHRNPDDLNKLAEFIRDLERLAYGLLIRRANVNKRIQRYGELLKAIEEQNDPFGKDGPLQLQTEEKAEIVRVLEEPVYTLPNVPKPLLLRLDSFLADTGATYDHGTVTIEHVLPQNPPEDSQWCKWFPDDEEREQWTHRLANLVLLSSRKNSSASNWEFERKKKEYFQKSGTTPFALTTQVVNESEWTPEVLEHRQDTLIDKLKEAWRLD